MLSQWEPRVWGTRVSSSRHLGAEGQGKLPRYPPPPPLLFLAVGLCSTWAPRVSLWSWASISLPPPHTHPAPPAGLLPVLGGRMTGWDPGASQSVKYPQLPLDFSAEGRRPGAEVQGRGGPVSLGVRRAASPHGDPTLPRPERFLEPAPSAALTNPRPDFIDISTPRKVFYPFYESEPRPAEVGSVLKAGWGETSSRVRSDPPVSAGHAWGQGPVSQPPPLPPVLGPAPSAGTPRARVK